MRTQIPVPSKGDAMRASWGAAVAGRVNELCAMAPAGMLSREGFGGIGAQPLPQNLRNRRTGGFAGNWPWDIRFVSDGEGEGEGGGDGEGEGEGGGDEPTPIYEWVRQYVQVGCTILVGEVTDNPAEHKGKFIGIVVTLAADSSSGGEGQQPVAVEAYDTIQDLIEAMANPARLVIPLGKLNAEGSGYEEDLRAMPSVTAWDPFTEPLPPEDDPEES